MCRFISGVYSVFLLYVLVCYKLILVLFYQSFCNSPHCLWKFEYYIIWNLSNIRVFLSKTVCQFIHFIFISSCNLFSYLNWTGIFVLINSQNFMFYYFVQVNSSHVKYSCCILAPLFIPEHASNNFSALIDKIDVMFCGKCYILFLYTWGTGFRKVFSLL